MRVRVSHVIGTPFIYASNQGSAIRQHICQLKFCCRGSDAVTQELCVRETVLSKTMAGSLWESQISYVLTPGHPPTWSLRVCLREHCSVSCFMVPLAREVWRIFAFYVVFFKYFFTFFTFFAPFLTAGRSCSMGCNNHRFIIFKSS